MDWHETGPATLGCGPAHPDVLQMCASGYGGYKCNTTLFPDPIAFLDTLHEVHGLQVMTNQHDQCAVDHCQDYYAVFAHRMGIDSATGAPVPCAFTNRTYFQELWELVLGTGANAHVDYAWEDYGLQGGIDGTVLGCVGDEHCMKCLGDLSLGASPLGANSAALWSAAVRVATRERQFGLRGMTLGVYGGLGHHRYGIVGSGDTHEAYLTLAFEVYASFTSANVLTAWTHDIGGFYPLPTVPTDDPEWMHDPLLFLRWVQFGCFSSFFRPHAAQGEVRPWMYPNARALEGYWRLRNALVPYIYAAAHLAFQTGVVLVRPLYFDYPNEENAYIVSQLPHEPLGGPLQYGFGEDMFVAAITANTTTSGNHAYTMNVWIPPGRWVPLLSRYNGSSAPVFQGPQWIRFTTTSDTEFPVFARAGAILPLRLLREQHDVAPQQMQLTVVWTANVDDATTTTQTIAYEDDGESLDYANTRRSRVLLLTHQSTANASTVLIQPKGMYPGSPLTRSYVLRFRGYPKPPSAASCNHQPVSWLYNPASDGGPMGDHDTFAHAARVTVPLLMLTSPIVPVGVRTS